MTGSVFGYVPFVLLWAATLYKLPAFCRSRHDPGRRSYWLTLMFLALALTALLPPIYRDIDSLTGVPNLARLLGDGLVLIACWTAQRFLIHLGEREGATHPGILHHWAVLLAALALMSAVFVSAPLDNEALDFTGRYGSSAFFLKYEAVFLGYLGLAMLNVAFRSWRYAAVAAHPSLRLGLQLITAGAVIGVVFVLQQLLYGLSVHFGYAYPTSDPALITQILAAAAIGVIVVGSTMPSWGPRVGIPSAYRWVEMYGSLRRLYPLWLTLCRANPEIALFPPPSRLEDTLTLRDLELRLYRRVIEIRDGWLALRGYVDPSVAVLARQLCEQAGLAAENTASVIDAAVLRTAISAKARGQVGTSPNATMVTPGGSNLETEIEILERLAWCFERSPMVREVVRSFEGERLVENRPAVSEE